jgi:hypothetical protein
MSFMDMIGLERKKDDALDPEFEALRKEEREKLEKEFRNSELENKKWQVERAEKQLAEEREFQKFKENYPYSSFDGYRGLDEAWDNHKKEFDEAWLKSKHPEIARKEEKKKARAQQKAEVVSKANTTIKRVQDIDEALDKIDVTALTSKYDQKITENTDSFKAKLDELYVKNEIDVKTRTEKHLTEEVFPKVKAYINQVVPSMIRQIGEEARAEVQAQITKPIVKETKAELTSELKEESVEDAQQEESLEESEEEVEKETETESDEEIVGAFG